MNLLTNRYSHAFLGSLAFAGLLASAHIAPAADDVVTSMVCVLSPTAGSQVSGTITFTAGADNTVTVHAQVSGLNPDSSHAFHIHEFGDLRSDDGTATGGHYNPEHHDHALPTEEKRHAGDLGNLKADGSGKANHTLVVDNISLAGPVNPIVGHAVIVHAKEDDGGQPTGNAGGRIAQGVIGIAKPAEEKK